MQIEIGVDMKVLVAESLTKRRQVIHAELEGEEQPVEIVDAGDGATAAASSPGTDVVIIDLSIEGLGVLGAISAIRASTNPPAIVALSAGSEEWRKQAALAEGAIDVIDWPEQADSLRARLAALLAAQGK